ncbi:guanine nucleotide binding protein, alpha subunit [Dichomitus squalens]|uniref:Guanine nucleotide binding protein, alpha subunit n=1 Tax=Dichomitus squalens TaxID=114155 RepID=A0A4Q9MIN0_9APHY|nr:guanine nucleotide binding protein, alpha subunit [Dichomitus squalens]
MRAAKSTHARSQQPPNDHDRRPSDPFLAALLPPPDETPEQREARLQQEEEARKRSENIDRMLRHDDKRNRRKKTVKVLLLGQSESGKSTTLKHNNGLDEEDFGDSTETASIIIASPDRPSSSHASNQPNYEAYRRRLAPLMDLEQRLINVLSDPEDNSDKEATHLPGLSPHSFSAFAAPAGMSPSTSAAGAGAGPTSPRSPTSPTVSLGSGSAHEPSIRTGSNWKKHFALGKIQSQKTAHSGELEGWWEDPGDPVHVLNRCAPVMKELWADPKIQQRLAEKKIRLEESSGFYLDEIDRITAKMYFPTDDDVLKARLKTTGVVEHKFTLAKNTEFRGVEWVIYDVGGARNQRQAWAPYFDDVNAIIFLAPISAFDQQLAEDPKVNRLEDSFLLWKSVIESKLLAHVNIVLFLNKCDLLKKKLESGVRLKHYMPSFNRPNDYDTVSQYFRNRFGAMHQQLSPNKSRELFIHLTAVTDTPKTHIIISNVRDIILTANLKSSSLM